MFKVAAPLKRKGKQTERARALPGVAICLLAGCQAALTAPPDAALEKLLRPVTTSPDSVTLEIFEVRIPLDENQRVESLWQRANEQCFDAELRRRLLANGLRVGVLGGTLPDDLSDLLGLTGEATEETSERVITPESAVPRVTRRIVQVNRQGQRTLQTTETLPEAQVLLSEDGQLRGKTYRQVEGRYELRAESKPGQRVSVRLAPELHHGELRNRYAGSDQGALLMIPSREREAFERLTVQAELAPGELLVVGCLPHAEGSLGETLHTASSKGRRERKFVLVRVLEAPASEILADQ
jgi:hypothetical protein